MPRKLPEEHRWRWIGIGYTISFEHLPNPASLQISLEILSDFSNKSLEGEFPDQQLGRSIISSVSWNKVAVLTSDTS